MCIVILGRQWHQDAQWKNMHVLVWETFFWETLGLIIYVGGTVAYLPPKYNGKPDCHLSSVMAEPSYIGTVCAATLHNLYENGLRT